MKKTRMKQLLSAVLAFALSLALVACGSNGDNSGTEKKKIVLWRRSTGYRG